MRQKWQLFWWFSLCLHEELLVVLTVTTCPHCKRFFCHVGIEAGRCHLMI